MTDRVTTAEGSGGDCCIAVRNTGPLSGEVAVPGAKNSVLKLMAASLLADGTFELSNVPDIIDVSIMAELLRAIGAEVEVLGRGAVTIRNTGDLTPVAPFELVEQMRASINVLGPLLTRCGHVRLSMPGGDDFGSRPIDMHIAGLEAMGASFSYGEDYVEASVDRLRGADIMFKFPSVGATENLVTAAVYADGVTTLENAAREPEIIDLCEYLVAMGAQIEGIGTSQLRITGVAPGSLRACEHETVPDRIQAATYIAACAVSGGRLDLLNAQAGHMQMVLTRFRDMGLEFEPLPYGLRVAAPGRLRSTDFATLPYPGIATDYKPLITTMLSVAEGVGIVTENLYPGRFRYVEELQRLGADIRTDGHHAVIRGVPRLVAAEVTAHDIRAGAAMVVAGLAAEGTTTITGVHHIDRGYDDLVGRLQRIGADITRFDA
ncbi:MAG: UDP-N-acetylglucosamine 1-carboxyvinyltransferase [Ilumatobacter sp.]|uniref:UDP-N-acetylglucosamine 1-carboxyvinyltransferase n=1 Tax=Ilumatobacter sp. TaxID=1967498 RepID=UPI002612F5CC|nr:UDP-N-acetylglucosamine 1-carboxyvinyltransferase [Ilumatobacter sp.]MDJ0768822.1 UDP-N-acetylglucosamine 1-carboxyvinyltransferase [Ilumatobacter sp.]